MGTDIHLHSHSYDGSIVVSARKLENAWKAIECAGQKIPSVSYLRDLLEILSIYALSRRLYWDGTIPNQWQEITQSAVVSLRIADRVEQLSPDPHEVRGAAVRAVTLCRPILKISAGRLPVGIYPVRPAAHEAFFHNVRKLSEAPTTERTSLALESMAQDSDGAKLLIGLSAECHEDVLFEVNRFQDALNSDDKRSALMWHLTESFRPFLLNEWGARRNAMVHVNNYGAHAIQSYRTWLWRDLEQAIRNANRNSELLPEAPDHGTFQAPMVGLEILRRAKDSHIAHPIELFEIANELVDEMDGFKQLQSWLVEIRQRVDRHEDFGQIVGDIQSQLKAQPWRQSAHEHRGLRRRMASYVLPAVVSAIPLADLLHSVGMSEMSASVLSYLLAVAAGVGVGAWCDANERGNATYVSAIEHLLINDSVVQKESIMEAVRVIWQA